MKKSLIFLIILVCLSAFTSCPDPEENFGLIESVNIYLNTGISRNVSADSILDLSNSDYRLYYELKPAISHTSSLTGVTSNGEAYIYKDDNGYYFTLSRISKIDWNLSLKVCKYDNTNDIVFKLEDYKISAQLSSSEKIYAPLTYVTDSSKGNITLKFDSGVEKISYTSTSGKSDVVIVDGSNTETTFKEMPYGIYSFTIFYLNDEINKTETFILDSDNKIFDMRSSESNLYSIRVEEGNGISNISPKLIEAEKDDYVILTYELKDGYKDINIILKKGESEVSGEEKDSIITSINTKQIFVTVPAANIEITVTGVPITYSVSFNGNGATGSMEIMERKEYDSEFDLTQNTYKKNNHFFKGWALSDTGELKYDDREKVSNLTTEDNSTVTLYAVWEEGFNVNLNLNDNTTEEYNDTLVSQIASLIDENEENITKIVITKDNNTEDNKKELPTPNRAGWAFTGWYTSDSSINDEDKVENTYDVYGKFKDEDEGEGHTLYAHWQPKNYTVTIVKGENVTEVSSSSSSGSNYYYGDNITVKATDFEYGYEFDKWESSDIDITDTYNSYYFSMPNKNVTLKAIAKPMTYKIKLEKNAGEDEVSFSSLDVFDNINKAEDGTLILSVTYGNQYGKLPKPTRSGYEFKGWYSHNTMIAGLQAITKATLVDGPPNNVSGDGYDGVLYAIWEQSNVN